MDGRIGALHVRYRIPPGSATAAALAPGLDRAIGARLGDAVAARMSVVLGADPAIIVIRELKTRVALDAKDLMLDGRVVERISRASVDAVTDLLHDSDTPDSVMRFADAAEFIGSFVLDLLQGIAWDRWYFGAFQAYRRTDVRESLLAVLADHPAECARVFSWLDRRGRLGDVLRLIGAAEARRLVSGWTGDRGVGAYADVTPLLDASFALVEALGWPRTSPEARRSLLAGFLSGAALPPAWSDRRALSAWVLECARAIAAAHLRAGVRPPQPSPSAAHSLFAGPLDWLDGSWLAEQIPHLLNDGGAREWPVPRGGRILSRNHERMLARLARRIAEGRIRLDRAADRDALVVRLVAAVAEENDESAPPDRALIATVERIADAWQSARATEGGASMLVRMLEAPLHASAAAISSTKPELASRVDAVTVAGSAALDVLRALAGTAVGAGADGDPMESAGLYLLTRGVLDVRLSMHAADAGVPPDLLRAALATHWFGISAPFDRATALWVGTESDELAGLSDCAAGLADLERSLFATLVDQRTLDAVPPDDADAVAPGASLLARGCPAAQARLIARIAWMVMRAWSRWLPGIGQASPAFLLGHALARGGRARVSDSRIDVSLEPASLDVVLEMAGYFKPIESVAWLGGRTVTFAVDRAGR